MSNYTDTLAPYDSKASSSSTITAFYEDRPEAEAAIERLVEAGIGRNSIRLVAGDEDTGVSSDVVTEDKGFWASLQDFFFPDEDRAVYAEGLRRGGYLVTVSGISPTLYETALDILDDEGSIDLDERAETWRSEGWDKTAARGDAVPVATDIAAVDDFAAETAMPRSAGLRDDKDEIIPVVEEQLRVGKRDLSQGSVRVRSYVVDRPVSEDVDTVRGSQVEVEDTRAGEFRKP